MRQFFNVFTMRYLQPTSTRKARVCSDWRKTTVPGGQCACRWRSWSTVAALHSTPAIHPCILSKLKLSCVHSSKGNFCCHRKCTKVHKNEKFLGGSDFELLVMLKY